MKLVLIEGPGKRESVQHYLGSDYKVMPTFGHCRDLPEKALGVNVANNFEPEYVVVPDHKKYVDDIKKELKKAERVYFEFFCKVLVKFYNPQVYLKFFLLVGHQLILSLLVLDLKLLH